MIQHFDRAKKRKKKKKKGGGDKMERAGRQRSREDGGAMLKQLTKEIAQTQR